MKMTSVLIVFGLALAACSGGDGAGEPAAEPEEAASLADPMVEAVEKAEAVQDTAMEHAEAIDEAVESVEDEDPPAEE